MTYMSTTRQTNFHELQPLFDETMSLLRSLVSSFNEEDLNTVPFEGSWTAGQVTEHLIKSYEGMARSLGIKGASASRDPEQRVPELKAVFLDFTKKFTSSAFILPMQESYEKKALVAALDRSISHFREAAHAADPAEVVTGLPTGEITKVEIFHLVIYHTQRHIHQLKNIYQRLQEQYDQPA